MFDSFYYVFDDTLMILLLMTMTDCLNGVNIASMLNNLNITDEAFHNTCDYLDPSQSEDIMASTDNDLNIVQLNIRGLISKQNAEK